MNCGGQFNWHTPLLLTCRQPCIKITILWVTSGNKILYILLSFSTGKVTLKSTVLNKKVFFNLFFRLLIEIVLYRSIQGIHFSAYSHDHYLAIPIRWPITARCTLTVTAVIWTGTTTSGVSAYRMADSIRHCG